MIEEEEGEEDAPPLSISIYILTCHPLIIVQQSHEIFFYIMNELESGKGMNRVKYVLYNIASFARWLAENLGPGARTGRTTTGSLGIGNLSFDSAEKMSCMLSPRWSATGALTVPGLALMFMLLMMSFPFAQLQMHAETEVGKIMVPRPGFFTIKLPVCQLVF